MGLISRKITSHVLNSLKRCDSRISFLLIFLFLISPLVFIGLIEDLNYRAETRLIEKSQQRLTTTLASAVDDKLDLLKDTAVLLANNVEIKKSFEEENWQEAIETISIFKKLLSNPNIDRIFVTDPDGTETAAYPELSGGVGNNFAFRDWYEGAIQGGGDPYISEVFLRASKPQVNIIAVSTPVISSSQEISGIIVIQVKTDHLLSLLESLDLGYPTEAYIVDQNNNIVAHTGYSPQADIQKVSNKEVIGAIQSKNEDVETLYSRQANESKLISYAEVSHYNWGVVLEEFTDTTFKERDLIRKVFVLLIFIVLIFSFILAIGINNIIRDL